MVDPVDRIFLTLQKQALTSFHFTQKHPITLIAPSA